MISPKGQGLVRKDSSIVPLREVASSSWDALLGYWRHAQALATDGEVSSRDQQQSRVRRQPSISSLLTLLREHEESVDKVSLKASSDGPREASVKTRTPATKAPSRSLLSTSSPSTGILPVEANVRAKVCRYNSVLAQSFRLSDIERLWSLLAVSFDVMALPAAEGGLLNSSWRKNVLGLALIRKLIDALQVKGDLVTVASVVCVLGGSEAAADLLSAQRENPHESNRSSCVVFDGILLSFAELLRRWGLLARATEVCYLGFILILN